MGASDKDRPAPSPAKHSGDKTAAASLIPEISHEIKTPLASMRSNNEILTQVCLRLRTCLLSEGTAAECAEILSILEAAVYANRLAYDRIADLLTRLDKSPEFEASACVEADLHEEIDRSLALLGSEFRSRVHVARNFGAIPRIFCRPAHIGQAITNILANAFQAIGDSGEIQIRTSKEDDSVRMEFQDNGKGIPPELQEKIFEPGVTTKPADSGHGLGLHICRRIVQDHGGRICVASEPGKGSTFTIILPVRQPEEERGQSDDRNTKAVDPDRR